jgi:hypothetical protein
MESSGTTNPWPGGSWHINHAGLLDILKAESSWSAFCEASGADALAH